jgi:hypothetical protein
LEINGKLAAFGNWNPCGGQKMGNGTNLQAMATVDVEKNIFPFEFKPLRSVGTSELRFQNGVMHRFLGL